MGRNYAIPPTPDELGSQLDSLNEAIESERPEPAVLLAAAYVDKCLAALLCAFFIEAPHSRKVLDFRVGFIRELSARADLAYCLGLISLNLYKNVMKIAEIRNRFSHSHVALTFDDPEIADKCMELHFPTGMKVYDERDSAHSGDGDPGKLWPKGSGTMRGRFQFVVRFVIGSLIGAIRATEHRKQSKMKYWGDEA